MIGWIIVVVVVVVTIVSHLASLNKGQPPQQGRPAGGNSMARARPTTSEIDRFLEEVNRRKQQQQERRTAPPPPPVQRERARPVTVDQRTVEQRPAVAKPVRVQQRQ